jgi:hypothetical protein
MPSVASLEALERAVAQFEVTELELAIEPPALDAARRSLDESGLLLLGEVHGVRENPLLVRALMRAFGLNALALEWPDELAPVIHDFMLMLVVAGNAHTPTTPTHLGIPLGACLARQRPGVLDIRIRYGSGHFYNSEPRRFAPATGIEARPVRLYLEKERLVLDLPEATEAIVPHRPLPAWPVRLRPGTAIRTGQETGPATGPDQG